MGIADDFNLWAGQTYGRATPSAVATRSVKADPVGALVVSSYGLSQPVRTPRRFDKLADAGYSQNPIVYRAINLIATAIAGIPWRLFQRVGTKKRGAELETHPLLDLMARPNPNQGWGKFIEAYISYLYVSGNSYLWANRPRGGGAPLELWTMRPDRMRILPDEKQFVAGYTYEINGARLDFDAASILHTKTFAPLDDWYGMSPLVVAARNIDIRNAGGDWNLALVQNSGRVPGFFVTTERLSDTQFERMREQLIDRYTGGRNVGLPGLLEEGLGWLEAGKTPRDMDWALLSKEQSRDIAITIGVPPELLGDSEVKTYSNYQEARASFYEETALPLADITRDEFNRWLTPMFSDNLLLDYDHEDIEALQEARGRLYQWIGKASFLTINEQREILGYPARPEGDIIVVPLQSATLEEVMEGHTDPQNQQGGAAPGKPLLPKPAGAPPNDGSDTDEGAPTPAPDQGADAAGGTGVADGGMASGVDAGAKSADPLDDLLAGKVVRFRPKWRGRSFTWPAALDRLARSGEDESRRERASSR